MSMVSYVVITEALHINILFLIFIYLKVSIREEEKEGKRVCLSAGSFPRWPQWAGRVRLKPGARCFLQVQTLGSSSTIFPRPLAGSWLQIEWHKVTPKRGHELALQVATLSTTPHASSLILKEITHNLR